MSDDLWAAREGDALLHTSVMADILGGVLEVAAYAAITYVGCIAATALIAVATGITIGTAGVGCVALGLAVGAIVGITAGLTGADVKISSWCESAANWVFPPVIDAFITSGSENVFINDKPAARAAGKMMAVPVPPSEPPAASFLDMAQNFFSQMWRPTVATPAPGTEPCLLDTVACNKHPPMPEQFLAEGSSSVFINGQPAARSGDRSTCDAKIGSAEGLISPDVRIGGETIVVREIRSGKTPGVGLAITALLMLRGNMRGFWSKLPCLVVSTMVGAATAWGTSKVVSAYKEGSNGSPNPVHSATGAKILGGEEELDFVVPGLLLIEWQRFYSSLDTRRDGLLGAGWSLPYEVSVDINLDQELLYTDEQGRQLHIGYVPLAGGAFSPGEGLAVRRSAEGAVLIESADGVYRLFAPHPLNASRLRLVQLGNRNDGRIYLDYDDLGRLARLRDTHDLMHLELAYDTIHPNRVASVERRYLNPRHFAGRCDVLVSYSYDTNGDLSSVTDTQGQTQRRFCYDEGRRMIEHQLPSGLRCFYQWSALQGPDGEEWRVTRHWTDTGEQYAFEYDLAAGVTQITDGLQRVSRREWNAQYQITRYTNNLGQSWQFEWNDQRQLLGATDPLGGLWRLSYDESGNLSKTVDPLGHMSSTLWLEHWSLPIMETDPNGNSWHYRYDSRGNRIESIDPLGHRTRYSYSDFGQPVKIVDPLDKSRTLRWNEWNLLTEEVDCSGYSTRYEYDAFGNLQKMINAEGEPLIYLHDPQGRLLQYQLPDGRTEQLQRNASGQVTAFTDSSGNTVNYIRDLRGLVRQRSDAYNRSVNFTYDTYGRIHQLTNENGESYSFSWDAGDRLIVQQSLDQSATRYSYDAMDNIIAIEDLPSAQGAPVKPIKLLMDNDALGRMLRKTTEDGETQYCYDANGQLTAISFFGVDGEQQHLKFDYDAFGRVQEEQSAAGSLRHHYDELGNLLQSRLPDGRWLNQLYYGSGHLHQINLDGQVISDFERDRLHRELQRTQGRLATRTDYDRCGHIRSRQRRMLEQSWQLPTLAEKQYWFDATDNLTQRRRINEQQDQLQQLGYDASGRLMTCQDTQHSETYAYDAAANLLDSTQRGGLVRHNRLLTYQDKRYRYDGFGRMVEKRSGSRRVQYFSYDAEHRLVEVRNDDGISQTQVRMSYDPIGRRIAKTEYDSHGQVLGQTRFTWDGLRLLQEQRHSQCSLYIYVEDGYELLARVDGRDEQQVVRYYHNDLNGLPEQLTEADGSLAWQAQYLAWGQSRKELREPYFIEEQNLRFQGQYLDRETGLHYNTFRFYDPDIGRYTTPDPIGLAGGLNLYSYGPNPVGWLDPLGWATRPNNGKYKIFFDHSISPDNRYASDAVQFRQANKEFIKQLNSDPSFKKTMHARYPGLGDWIKNGDMGSSPSKMLTWHHHEKVNRLVLVDYRDHRKNHGLYHPTGKGGRDIWGGGPAGRHGQLNGKTGAKRC